MTGVHVAHDCIIGNNVILVNLVALGGHVEIDDWAILGGASNVHQFCKVGKHAMIAANSKLVQDVPPFILAGKHPVQYSGINSIGLSRRGFTDNEKADIKKAYRYLFRSDLNQSDALAKVKKSFLIITSMKFFIFMNPVSEELFNSSDEKCCCNGVYRVGRDSIIRCNFKK